MSNYGFEKLSYPAHGIRLGQLISTFGPGAIVDFTDQSLMVAAPKYWREYNIIHDERLEKKLHVDGFRIPKGRSSVLKKSHLHETGVYEDEPSVPFVRFPEWYFCPKCRKLQRISEWEKEYYDSTSKFMKTPKCLNCNIPIIPMSILVACKNGHVDDFPWEEWVHMGKEKICDHPHLKIMANSGTLGLESLKVECTTCGTIKSLKGAFKHDILKRLKNKDGSEFQCSCRMPWKSKNKDKSESCGETPQAILRNASSLYFAKIESSLVIPPYSDRLNVAIENSHQFESFLNIKNKKEEKGKLKEFLDDNLEDYIDLIAEEINYDDKEAVKKIIDRKLNGDVEIDNTSRNTYRYEEYEVLLGNVGKSLFDDYDFKTEIKEIKDYNMPELSNVTLVKKLKEVRALVGHTRIKPPEQYIMGVDNNLGEAKLVNIKEYTDKWYPAYEVRGEGIFIELNSDLIDKWVGGNSHIIKNIEKLDLRYNKEKSIELKRKITPKFVLLHTFSHILIRELSFECGYSSTSIRERIYCDLPGEENKMNGILIYTADADSEGSLGGLVKQGNPEFLPRIIKNAINRAKWCSADPVCINSDGQGRDSLNLAACHNCVLLPETSCEEFNVLLDRATLVGNLENKKIGFFSRYI